MRVITSGILLAWLFFGVAAEASHDTDGQAPLTPAPSFSNGPNASWKAQIASEEKALAALGIRISIVTLNDLRLARLLLSSPEKTRAIATLVGQVSTPSPNESQALGAPLGEPIRVYGTRDLQVTLYIDPRRIKSIDDIEKFVDGQTGLKGCLEALRKTVARLEALSGKAKVLPPQDVTSFCQAFATPVGREKLEKRLDALKNVGLARLGQNGWSIELDRSFDGKAIGIGYYRKSVRLDLLSEPAPETEQKTISIFLDRDRAYSAHEKSLKEEMGLQLQIGRDFSEEDATRGVAWLREHRDTWSRLPKTDLVVVFKSNHFGSGVDWYLPKTTGNGPTVLYLDPSKPDADATLKKSLQELADLLRDQ